LIRQGTTCLFAKDAVLWYAASNADAGGLHGPGSAGGV